MKINSGQAPSTLVPKYIGSDFDHVVTVGKNIDYVKNVAEGIEGLPVISYIGEEPPTQPAVGATWYCTLDGRTYVWYRDTDSYQWVESSPQSAPLDLQDVREVAIANTERQMKLLGYDLVKGSFEEGALLSKSTDVVLYKHTGVVYKWKGVFPAQIAANSTPTSTGISNWEEVVVPVMEASVREALRRSYTEAGYTLVAGSFEAGGTVASANDVMLYEATGVAYSYGGALPHIISAGENPVGNPLWVDKSLDLLRNELSIKTLETFGATGGVDDTAAMNAAINTDIQITNKEFRGNPKAFTKMGMMGRTNSSLKQLATTGNFLSFSRCQGGRLDKLTIKANRGGVSTAGGQQVAIVDGNDLTLSDLNFEDVEGSGFGILSYPNVQTEQKRMIIKSIRGKYNTAAYNSQSGCVLLAQGQTSIIDGVTATGYGQFGAAELKDNAINNIVTNIISDGCSSTVYLGQESGFGPSRNIIANVMGLGNRSEVVNLGIGNGNLVTNVMADFAGSAATQPKGVQMEGNMNAVDNLYYTNVGAGQVAYPILFKNTATNNYASIFAHHSTTQMAVFEPNTRRNFVEVKHPGDKNDIFSASGFIMGDETITSDNNGNVLHSPMTGQYLGSVSGKFEWRMRDMTIPTGVMFSGDRFRFLDTGNPGLVVGGGTTAQLKLFTADGTYRTVHLAPDQAIRVDTDVGAYLRFGSTALTPSATNVYALGASSRAWSGGFTQTAFIVTSDARHKTAPLDITDTILDAWSEVDWVQYQFLDSVENKGSDGARWHFGVVAQRAKEAFERHGLDAHDYGFFCYDQWDAVPAEYRDATKEEIDNGEVLPPATTVLVSPAIEAGNKYGIRYEEALALEAALQRRNYQRLLARVEALEAK